MSSSLISGSQLLTLRCLARGPHCLRLLLKVVDWCVSLLAKLICCRIILTASCPGRLLICRSLAICLLVLPPLPSGRDRSGISLDLNPYGGTDPLGMFPLFLKRTADVMAPHLCVVFRRLVCLGSVLACYRQVNVTPIPKGARTSSVDNNHPISITSVLSVFERLVSVCLRTTNAVVCFQPLSLLIGNVGAPVKKKGKVFYGQEPPSGESTTTESGVNYQLLSVMHRSSPQGNS